MEVKKYNLFAVIKPKPKAKPLPKAKIKRKPKTELQIKGLTLDNKQKLDTIYDKAFVKTSRK